MGGMGGVKGATSRRKGVKGKATFTRKLSTSTEKALLDDDSGLGDSSLDCESHSTTMDQSLSGATSDHKMIVEHMLVRHVGVNSSQDLTTINPQAISPLSDFHTKEPFRDSGPKYQIDDVRLTKYLRLDPPEEANELPGEQQSSSGDKDVPPLLSFKNVPAILTSLKPVQKTSLLCLEPVQASGPRKRPSSSISPEEKTSKRKAKSVSILEGNFPSKSSDGKTELKLINQPEEQHRARYQTEGSRGAVKDMSGQGHPTLKLCGYSKSSILEVFVASDGGVASPHLFYQACKVTGKNSTPCDLEKVNGTVILKINFLPENDMTISCDCVGILKERNVDVEQRMRSCLYRAKKKSTKCRLVFRTVVTLASGVQETLQVVSHTICCTQLPGLPEISRKSLSECDVSGGKELFIIGKNLKDSEVLFQEIKEENGQESVWSETVIPDKEYLQPTHLICEVPPYRNQKIKEEVTVQIVVVSGGKSSESSTFKYTPLPCSTEPLQTKTYQLHNLPKGVSPSAVELNMLYNKSGNELPIKDNSALHQVLSGNRNTNNGVLVSRVLATVTPEIRPVTVLPTRRNTSSQNTITTSSVLASRPSLSSEQSGNKATTLQNRITNDIIKREVEAPKVISNLDNWEGTLNRVIKSKSSEIRTMIVDSLMDEIVSKIKNGKVPNSEIPNESNYDELLLQISSLLEQKNSKRIDADKKAEATHVFIPNITQNPQVSPALLHLVTDTASSPTCVKVQKFANFAQHGRTLQDSEQTRAGEESHNTMTKWVVNNPIYPPFVKVNVNENLADSIEVESFGKTEISQTPVVYKINTEVSENHFPPKQNLEKPTESFYSNQDVLSVKNENLNLSSVMTQTNENPMTVNVFQKNPIGVNTILVAPNQASQYQQPQQQFVSFIPKNEKSTSSISTCENVTNVQVPTEVTPPHYAVQVIPETKPCHAAAVNSQVNSQVAEPLPLRDDLNMAPENGNHTIIERNPLSLHLSHAKDEKVGNPCMIETPCMVDKTCQLMNSTIASSNEVLVNQMQIESHSESLLINDPLLCQTSNHAIQVNNPPSIEATRSAPTPNNVPMPPEVTNVISNFSDTEFLNNFNPSCFDNV